MVTDSAWFYSSLAQASAALIGLLGGVLILRLQQQSVAVLESRDRVLDAFRALRANTLRSAVEMAGFIDWIGREIDLTERGLAAGERSRNVREHRTWLGGVRGSSDAWQVPISPEALEALQLELTRAQQIVPLLQDLARTSNADAIDKSVAALRAAVAALDAEGRAQIDAALMQQIDSLLRLRRIHRLRVKPWGAVGLLLVMLYLAFVSVAFPLSALIVPPPAGATASLLFNAFVTGLLLLFLYLAVYVGQLLRQGNLRDEDE